jgi:dTDP-4-amino-4,6-dideoxygalactose transaminase
LKDACDCLPGACVELQQSEQAQDHCVVLPLFPRMTREDQRSVADALNLAIEKYANHPKNPAETLPP